MKVLHIGQRDGEMGKNYAAAMAVRADVKETLKVLTPLLVEMGGDARRRRNAEMVASLADRNWSATKKKRTEAAKAKAGQSPMSADWLMMSLRSEEHTSELQSLMRISYAVFCLKKKNKHKHTKRTATQS